MPTNNTGLTASKISKICRDLFECAEYALNSHSRDLVFQTYGQAIMAYNLNVITKDQFFELNTMLIRNGINNPAVKLD